MIVYIAENLVNGKKYVGITEQPLQVRRLRHEWDSRQGSTCHLAQALRKYGYDQFSWTAVASADSRESLQQLERDLIAELGTMGPAGYNMTPGGDGWHTPHSEETRMKMSLAQKRRHADPELRAHLSRKMREFATSNREEMSRRAKMNNRPMTEKEIAAYARRREQLELRKRQRDGA